MKKLILFLLLICSSVSFSQNVKVIGLTQDVTISSYHVRVMQSGLTDVKLKKLDLSITCTGSEIGSTGFYKFTFDTTTSYQGFYKLYINGTEKQEYGIVQVGKLLDNYGTIPMMSSLNMNSQKIINLANPTTASDAVTYGKLNSRLQNIIDSADSKGLVTKTGSQSITGVKEFENGAIIRGRIETDYADPDIETSTTALVTKAYVDAQINTVTVNPYQESSNSVRIITNGTTETGKVYASMQTAATYLSPTSTKPCIMNLFQGNVSTGLHYLTASGTTKDYLTFQGNGVKATGLVFDESASLTKNASFKDMSIYYGLNAISGARSYNSFKFENCIIYAYNNVTFTNCEFYNVTLYFASSKNPTFTNCILVNSGCNQYITDGGSNKFLNFTAGFNTGYSMPSDPSLAP